MQQSITLVQAWKDIWHSLLSACLVRPHRTYNILPLKKWNLIWLEHLTKSAPNPLVQIINEWMKPQHSPLGGTTCELDVTPLTNPLWALNWDTHWKPVCFSQFSHLWSHKSCGIRKKRKWCASHTLLPHLEIIITHSSSSMDHRSLSAEL